MSKPQLSTSEKFLAEVRAGLGRTDRELPCKYFYDERGSQLFEEICGLEEYYLTRTELALMHAHVGAMAEVLGPECMVIEYGSGSGIKTRLLLEHLADPIAYVPIDLAAEALSQTASELSALFPQLEIKPLLADFAGSFSVPTSRRTPRRRVLYFPGSTLGNFGPPEAEILLKRVASLVGPGGAMLLGIDLRKPLDILEPAYDDSRGVTAAFNLNLLARINRELGADFNLAAFRHRAFYNTSRHCIEMHLVSTRRQSVHLAGETYTFADGESVRTERSYKYDVDEFSAWVVRTGLRVEQVWTDDRRRFAVLYLTAG